MPDPVPFDLAAYCNNPAYSAQLEVGLYANDVDVAAGVRLEQLLETEFAGYRRHRGDIWAQRLPAGQGGPLLRSRSLTWICREPSPGAIARGVFVVAVMADGPQLVNVAPLRSPKVLSAAGRSVTLLVALAALQVSTPART